MRRFFIYVLLVMMNYAFRVQIKYKFGGNDQR